MHTHQHTDHHITGPQASVHREHRTGDTAAAVHEPTRCHGCDHILGMGDLVVALRLPVHTLYKLSGCDFPTFPRRLRDRRTIAVRCSSVKEYLAAVER